MLEGTYPTNFNGMLEIIKDDGWKDVTVRFLDTGTIKKARRSDILNGFVKDLNRPSVFGVGFIGEGEFGSKTGIKKSIEYKVWQGMLRRCYDSKFKARRPTYENCECQDEWKCLQNFSVWCTEQHGFNLEGWDLDKDLLIKGNKLYSENTCVFIPNEINLALTKNNINRGELPIGVRPTESGKRFTSYLHKDGKLNYLGSADSPEGAFVLYKEAK